MLKVTTSFVAHNIPLIALAILSALVYMVCSVYTILPLLQLILKPMPIWIFIIIIIKYNYEYHLQKEATMIIKQTNHVIVMSVLVVLGLIASSLGDLSLNVHDVFITHQRLEVQQTAHLLRNTIKYCTIVEQTHPIYDASHYVNESLLVKFANWTNQHFDCDSIPSMQNKANEQFLHRENHCISEPAINIEKSIFSQAIDLIYKHHIFFLLGIACFMIAHVFYICAFSIQGKFDKGKRKLVRPSLNEKQVTLRGDQWNELFALQESPPEISLVKKKQQQLITESDELDDSSEAHYIATMTHIHLLIQPMSTFIGSFRVLLPSIFLLSTLWYMFYSLVLYPKLVDSILQIPVALYLLLLALFAIRVTIKICEPTLHNSVSWIQASAQFLHNFMFLFPSSSQIHREIVIVQSKSDDEDAIVASNSAMITRQAPLATTTKMSKFVQAVINEIYYLRRIRFGRVIGVMLFMLSDAIVAMNSFGVIQLNRCMSTTLIMVTYYLAQFLIAISVTEYHVEILVKECELNFL